MEIDKKIIVKLIQVLEDLKRSLKDVDIETENTLTNKVVSFTDAEEYLAEQHMWEYRQCPNTPAFLPYSADTPIHACPSHYFDIPYYAAIGKFGFYGARFFNSNTPNSF